MPSALSPRLRGALLVAGACVCWSSGGLLVRLLDLPGIAIVSGRSLMMSLAVALGLVLAYGGRGAVARVRAVGWPGVLSAVLLTGAFVFYILSLKETTVANTLVLMSASPLVAAVLAAWWLREPLTWRPVAAIAVAAVGIAVMVAHGLAAGEWLGDAFALIVALSFGANIVVLRRWRGIDMVPATLLAGLLSGLVTLPFVPPVAPGLRDIALLLALGFFQLGLGLFLFVRGSRYLAAAELGLLTLLEAVLAPIWVWVLLDERPATTTLIGGALVLAALIGYSLVSRAPAAGMRARSPAASR